VVVTKATHMNIHDREKEGKVKRVTFRVPIRVWDRLRHEAARERTTVQDICTAAVEQYFEQRKEERSAKSSA